MSAIDKEVFPKPMLYAAAGIIALTIFAAAYGRYQTLTHPPETTSIDAPVRTYVDLKFADESDGSVSVRNAATQALVLSIKPGEDAFIRAVVRGFIRDRKAMKIDKTAPFRLYELTDTRLVIEDTTTHKRINLRAFGPTQQAAFARLMVAPTPS